MFVLLCCRIRLYSQYWHALQQSQGWLLLILLYSPLAGLYRRTHSDPPTITVCRVFCWSIWFIYKVEMVFNIQLLSYQLVVKNQSDVVTWHGFWEFHYSEPDYFMSYEIYIYKYFTSAPDITLRLKDSERKILYEIWQQCDFSGFSSTAIMACWSVIKIIMLF